MAAVIQTPHIMIEAVADLRFPPRADQLLQTLTDRNTESTLSRQEKEERAALVELSETIALVRTQARHLLGRKPA